LTRIGSTSVVAIMAFIGLFRVLIQNTKSGFVPDEDQGTFFANISLPPSSSLDRTQKVLDQVDNILEDMDVVDSRLAISGFGIVSGSGSQYGFVVGELKPWDKREKSVNDVIAELRQKTAGIDRKSDV